MVTVNMGGSDRTVKCCGYKNNLDLHFSDVRYSMKRSWIQTKKFSNKMFGSDSLRRGAGPNVQDDNGYTPLHHACLNGHREIVHTLLEMGASPCTVDKKGATPLHLAAFKGDAEAVGMLLEHNSPPVNVDQLTHDGDSALLIAAQFGFTSVVSQLIARGADVTIKNVNGDSALDLAAHYGKYSVVRHLLHVRPQLVDQYMNRNKEYTSTPLHRASMNGRKEVVIALLDAGMDPNVRTANGTPLHEAARYGKASVVRVLLNKGADLHAMDSKKKTVYDLLAEYPEEALRKVRKAIREYVTNAASYESDNEDLPPFPVPEYSPTPPLSNKFSPKIPAQRPLRTKASLPNLNVDKQRDIVTNAQSQSKFPPSPKSPSRSPVSDIQNEEFRLRSNTFQDKANNNKQLKILGDSIKSNARSALLYNHQNQVIYELEKKINTPSSEGMELPESPPEKEIVYANVNNNASLEKIYDRKRCDTLEPPNMVFSDAFESGSMKRKPKPLPKPTSSSGDEETDMYVNESFKKVEEGIYENTQTFTNNISDDEKVKNAYSDDPELDTTPTYFPMIGLRLQHQRSTINVCGHSCDNIDTYDDVSYVKMEGKTIRDRRLSNPVYLSMERLKTDSFHLKGDVGCLYGSNEYLYIYEINPKTLRGNAHPFIRKKEKASPMPCYCHEDPKKEEKMFRKNKPKQSSGSQLVFYSCEDIYVPMNREDIYSSLNDLKNDNVQFHRKQSRDEAKINKPTSQENVNMSYQSHTLDSRTRSLLRKKVFQVKQLLTDF